MKPILREEVYPYRGPTLWERLTGRTPILIEMPPQAHRIRVTRAQERAYNEARYLCATLVAIGAKTEQDAKRIFMMVLDATRHNGSKSL
jgi:hypothetical protein